MKETRFKQCACISEASADSFQDAANAILAQLADPEIVMDHNKPFTMYVFYNVRRDAPESVLELLELLDTDGGSAKCQNCPAFIKSKDRRRKWGKCRRKNIEAKADSRACELYYLEKRREAAEIANEFEQIPYMIG